MHADQLDIDVALVGRLVSAQFPEWAGLQLEPVHSDGTVNAIYRLGTELAVRLPLRRAGERSLRKERLALSRLAPRLPLAVPEPIAAGAPGEGYPCEWSVFRWIEGEPWRSERVADPCRAASELARFVAALRAVDPADGPSNPLGDRGSPLASRDAAAKQAIAALEGEIDARAVRREWEAACAATLWDRRPVWFHGDLLPMNLLLADGRLCAILDFGTAAVGDPACDGMPAWVVFAGEARTVFQRELGGDGAFWARARGWALSTALIAWAYYRRTNPAMVARARRTLAVLADGPLS